MRFTALATDFDGTLAYEGVVARPTVEALPRYADEELELSEQDEDPPQIAAE